MKISLRKLNEFDVVYFSKWMQDQELINLINPGGEIPLVSEIQKGFLKFVKSEKDIHHIITVRETPIGLISLLKDSKTDWYKMQIIIGEKEHWSKGYDIEAVKMLSEMMEKEENINLCLEVNPENERAIAAFAGCGFVPQKIKKYPKDINFPQALRMEFKGGLNYYNS